MVKVFNKEDLVSRFYLALMAWLATYWF